MRDALDLTYTAFHEHRKVAAGPLAEVAVALRERALPGIVLVFDDVEGRQLDLDLRGEPREVAARYGAPPKEEAPRPRRGRPRLGVVGREVTLLPRHWTWLEAQRGGASAALRRLVDEARARAGSRDRIRAAQDAINRFTSAAAGDLPGFEEATRALYRGEADRFADQTADWPRDLRRYLEHWTDIAFEAPAERSDSNED